MENIFFMTRKNFLNSLFQEVSTAIGKNDPSIINNMKISVLEFLKRTHIIKSDQSNFTVNDLKRLRSELERSFGNSLKC